ncbi:MAG: hypothetical protein BWY82_01251 [Verrucomicrobia bacterium ADurb.Bin474]|nr:MAG: hypothetical protein BWY82_01251 [Verrucomicrobia bacterium ADurb.Bin474]
MFERRLSCHAPGLCKLEGGEGVIPLFLADSLSGKKAHHPILLALSLSFLREGAFTVCFCPVYREFVGDGINPEKLITSLHAVTFHV